MTAVRTYFGCPSCTWVLDGQHAGKCPSCDGPLGYFSLGGPRSADRPLPAPLDEPEQSEKVDSSLEKGKLDWYYWKVELNNAGRRLVLNFLATSADHARQRALRLCRINGWKICTLEGKELCLPMDGEPARSIFVRQLATRPAEYYDEKRQIVRG